MVLRFITTAYYQCLRVTIVVLWLNWVIHKVELSVARFTKPSVCYYELTVYFVVTHLQSSRVG